MPHRSLINNLFRIHVVFLFYKLSIKLYQSLKSSAEIILKPLGSTKECLHLHGNLKSSQKKRRRCKMIVFKCRWAKLDTFLENKRLKMYKLTNGEKAEAKRLTVSCDLLRRSDVLCT